VFPSVTTVIKAAAAPELEHWKRRQLALLAARNTLWLGQLADELGPEGASAAAMKEAERAALRAASVGDEIHAWLEGHARGETPPKVSEVARPWLRGAEHFLRSWQPVFHEVELTVASTRHKYAGTTDFYASFPKAFGDAIILGDYKTGKAVHPDAAVQLAALARAEGRLGPDGIIGQSPVPAAAVVVHIHPKLPNGVEVLRMDIGEGPWERFRACLALWRSANEAAQWIGPAFDSQGQAWLSERQLEKQFG